MGQKVIILVSAIVLFAGLTFAFLYFNGGLRQYFRAVSLISELPIENKEKALDLLYGNTKSNEYGGIYAGTTKTIMPRVWVWGKYGLKPFSTDEYSVFWHLKGCKEGLLGKENNKIRRERDETLEDWIKQVRTGDYVMVIITTEKMGGTKGNLREVVGMDWWAFLQSGMEAACKK